MKIDKYFFRIKKSEQGKYSGEGITLDEKYTIKYDEETIKRAKILKAKNESLNPDPTKQKYSDQFYLAYAKSLQLQDLLGAFNEIYSNRLANYEIKDKNWAGYSYEEIIEMENQGFNIPEDVLLWAHAQQEADVTDYIIVSSSTNIDDSETTTAVDGNDELQNLQKRARENINKAEKANEIAETKEAEFKKIAKEAHKIQGRKKFLHDKSVEKIESMAKEWKELDDKKKNGKLSFAEHIKYKSLSKKLNGKNNEDGTMIKSIEANNAVLDEFLTSLDDLQNDVTENLELASDTTKSGRDLSEFEKNYREEKLPQVTTGITNNGMGLDSDELYSANIENIADIAIETGKDLEVSTNDINTNIQSDTNVKLAKFAQDYTNRASEALSNTRDIMNGNEEQEENDNKKDKEEKLKSYNVDIEFSHKNAQKAAKTTLLSTANLIIHQNDVSKNENSLQKELKKNTKDIKNLNKESKTTEQKHEENLQKEEQLITKLETEQGKTVQGSLEEKVDKAIKAQKKDEVQAQETSEKMPQEENQETATILDEIKSIDESDKKLKKDFNKTLSKGIQSDSTSQKTAKTLTTNNSKLAIRNRNAQQVAVDTITVGNGTFAKSFITTAAGEAMYNSGLGLMSNLLTYKTGLTHTIAGNYLKGEGQKEFKNGLLATATGAIGLTTSIVADNINSNARNSVKEANIVFKNNKQLFKKLAKDTGEENNVQPTQQPKTESAEQTPALQMQEENVTSTKLPEQNTTEDNTPLQQENTPVEQTPTDKTEQTTQNTLAEEQTTPIENTDKTQTTEEKEDNKQDKNKNQTYSVSTGFTAYNASKATQTTNLATAELFAYNSQVNGLKNSVTSQIKNSKNLTKKIQKEASQAIAQHQNNIKLTETIMENFANEKAQIDNIQTNEEATSIRSNMENMSDEFAMIATQDQETTNSANKEITKNSIQLDKYKTNVKTLNTELPTFDKLIANQLEVSQKTLVIGIGTTAFGTLHSIQGANEIAEGTILMTNPFTYSLGVIETVIGTLTLNLGISEISTGTMATVTGANGITSNNNARETSTEANNTTKSAQNEYKQADKIFKENKKELTSEQETTESPTTDDIKQKDQEKEIIIEEEPEQTELNTTIAASATANANINNNTTTDDKADRKLSRFNMDSIIESKKKQRKVQAVSASARNGK